MLSHALILFCTHYLQSTWFPCLLTASHLYYRCQIQWHWCSLLQPRSELYRQHSSFRVSDTKANLTYAVPAARRYFSLVHTKKALLPVCYCMFSLPCVPAALLQLWVSLQDSAEHVPGHNQEIQEWKKVIRGRWESICIYFAAFVCETSSSIFIWFSLVTKAPSALLSTCTEQQGIMYAQTTGAVWLINTKVTHFKSARRQAGSVPYHVRANVSVPGFCLWQWLVPDALQRKAKTVDVDKAISVQHWELIAEDWLNPWTLCLALFPNNLLTLITTLHIVDGYNLLEVLLYSWPQWLSCVNDFYILITCEKVFPSFIEVLI